MNYYIHKIRENPPYDEPYRQGISELVSKVIFRNAKRPLDQGYGFRVRFSIEYLPKFVEGCLLLNNVRCCLMAVNAFSADLTPEIFKTLGSFVNAFVGHHAALQARYVECVHGDGRVLNSSQHCIAYLGVPAS